MNCGGYRRSPRARGSTPLGSFPGEAARLPGFSRRPFRRPARRSPDVDRPPGSQPGIPTPRDTPARPRQLRDPGPPGPLVDGRFERRRGSVQAVQPPVHFFAVARIAVEKVVFLAAARIEDDRRQVVGGLDVVEARLDPPHVDEYEDAKKQEHPQGDEVAEDDP